MASGDLTTLNHVKAWRSPAIVENVDNVILSREITAASKAVLQYLQRKFLAVQTVTEVRNGVGTQGMMLKNYPILAVTGVKIGAIDVPVPQQINYNGFVFDADSGMLYVRGFVFSEGFQNVAITYRAGYQSSDVVLISTAVAPDYASVSCDALADLWVANVSVAYQDGSLLTPVLSVPGPAQYVVPTSADGSYQFSPADSGTPVTITYGMVPRDIEEATIDMVILEYNRRDRIGLNTKTLATQSISYYSSGAMTPTITSRLSSYMNVVPILP